MKHLHQKSCNQIENAHSVQLSWSIMLTFEHINVAGDNSLFQTDMTTVT